MMARTLLPRRTLAVVTGMLVLTACAPDKATGPGTAGHLQLDAGTTTSLASLGDTLVVTPRVLSRTGQPLPASGIAFRLSRAGVVEDLGGGRFRAIGNGTVLLRASIDTANHGVVPAGYFAAGVADSIAITVQQVPVSLSILATADTLFTAIDEPRPLQVRAIDARGNTLTDGAPAVTFSAADSTVVKVNGAGLLTSRRDGATQVTAQVGALTASKRFIVSATRQHTSCMTYMRRRRAQSSCATVDVVVRYPGATP